MAFRTWNGPMPTSAAQQSVTTGTAVKTMLQVASPSTRLLRIISWGFSVDDPPGADGVVELLQTDTAATVTAHVASGIVNTDPNGSASLVTLGTSATGYTSSAEGTPAALRVLDVVSLSSTSGESPLVYTYQFMPDERPIIAVSKFLRIRATTPTTAVDMRCWVTWDEL